MKKHISLIIPKIQNWDMMNNINSLLYCNEQLKIETDMGKRNILQNRFDEMQLSIRGY